jgi:hypothetical protein
MDQSTLSHHLNRGQVSSSNKPLGGLGVTNLTNLKGKGKENNSKLAVRGIGVTILSTSFLILKRGKGKHSN